MFYKVTYNQPGFVFYKIVEANIFADSKWHAIELAFSRNASDYPNRSYYKAKLIK